MTQKTTLLYKHQLDYSLPSELIARNPQRPTRVLWSTCPWNPENENPENENPENFSCENLERTLDESSALQKDRNPDHSHLGSSAKKEGLVLSSLNSSATPNLANSLNVQELCEMNMSQLIQRIPSGDLFILNNTKVLKRRVFSQSEKDEILFIHPLDELRTHWTVLFPSKSYKIHDKIQLPHGITMELLEKGLPQRVRTSIPLPEDYFDQVGEPPLPPYIQAQRNQRHTCKEDETWYQSQWAQEAGSLACPTASLHWSKSHLEDLRQKGVQILEVTLHVGLGTFLPVHVENLDEHVMHPEQVLIPPETANVLGPILEQRRRSRLLSISQRTSPPREGPKIWALGTTVARSLESFAMGLLSSTQGVGSTSLFIRPGYTFQLVDRLITNFHQPESTLLALVAAFAGLEKVKHNYQWAIQNQFRFLSYGDLSVWIKE